MRPRVLLEMKAGRFLASVTALGFALRLGWLVLNRPVPVSDFATYRALASGILKYGQFGYPDPSAFRLPGYPLMLSAFMLVSEHELWLGVSSVIVSTALVAVVYFWVRSAWSESVARISALLLAVYPTFVFSASLLASEHLSALLLVAGLWLVAAASRADDPGGAFRVKRLLFSALGAGLLLGYASLTRGDMLAYTLVFPALFYGCWRARVISLRAGIAAVAVFGVAVSCVLAPWWLRNQNNVFAGAGLSTSASFNLYLAHNARGYGWRTENVQKMRQLPEKERAGRSKELALEHIERTGFTGLLQSAVVGTGFLLLAPPLYAAKWSTVPEKNRRYYAWNARLGHRAVPYILLSLFYYATAAASVLALVRRKRYKVPATIVLSAVSIMALNWVVYAVVFWAKPRYRFISEVLLCVLASGYLAALLAPRASSLPSRVDTPS